MTAVDRVHALLFVADQPATIEALAAATALSTTQIEQALEILERDLAESGPIQLVHLAGGVQLATKPAYAEMVQLFLRPQHARLGRSLMEVLAIVAYRQPMTVAEIDAVRGVQSDHAVRTLVDRRLLEERGRRNSPGRPILYGTTPEFLHQFKLDHLDDLPPLDAPDSPLQPSLLAELPPLEASE